MSEEAGDALLDKEIEMVEITKCVRKLKNNKTGGSDGIVGELPKYDGLGMVNLFEQLFQLYGRSRLSPGNGERALLTLCTHARSEGYCSCPLCVCMYVCVCLSLRSFLPPRASRPRNIGTYVFTTRQKKLL